MISTEQEYAMLDYYQARFNIGQDIKTALTDSELVIRDHLILYIGYHELSRQTSATSAMLTNWYYPL